MKVIKGKSYRIKGNSKYFKGKYGTHNPIICIEDTDEQVFGGSWGVQNGNPTCLLFAMRCIVDLQDINLWEDVYYGKINSLGELVHASELELADFENLIGV